MSESSSSSDGIEIECGGNQARLFRKKFKLGSRVAECIQYNGELYTPTRFQGLSGRRAAKNWKTSFLCNGKAIGDVMKRGELCHSNDSNCDCECSWCAHCRECSRTPTRRKKTEECDLYESPESDTCYDNSQDSSYKPGYAERYVPNKGIGSRKRQRRRTRHGENGGRKAQTVEIESEKTFVKDEDDAVKDESVNSDDKKDKDNGKLRIESVILEVVSSAIQQRYGTDKWQSYRQFDRQMDRQFTNSLTDKSTDRQFG